MITWFLHTHYWSRNPGMLFPGAVAQKTSLPRLYRNTKPEGAPKEVFANMVQGFATGGADASLAVKNVHAWVRQVDVEYGTVELAFAKSDAWVLGFKSEGHATTTFFQASDHSRLELLGGLYCTYPETGLVPLAVSRDSEVCLSLSSFGGAKAGAYPVVLRDERNGQVTEVPDTRFEPRRAICPGERIIPLLTNTPK